jgi:sarcosine oxidase
VFDGSRRSCVEHGLAHEVLDARDLRRRVPAWEVPDDMLAVRQPDGGFLVPERCIAAHVRRARAAGADIREREAIVEWKADRGAVRVKTEHGTYEAGQLVLAAGPWLPAISHSLRRQLRVERQVVGWFEVSDSARFTPDAFPVFVFESPGPGHPIFYGFPEHGLPGMKIGRYHHRHEQVNADHVIRTIDGADEAVLREALVSWLPSANGRLLRATVCLFTNTPDEHFVIDRDPASPEVLLVSPCSGHGFKFCTVVGEIVADLVQSGSTRHDIALFRATRRLPSS